MSALLAVILKFSFDVKELEIDDWALIQKGWN
jgi:hypothetical protein